MAEQALADLTVREFLDRLAANTPTPGGGSVAALTGALAAGLGRMVAGYTLGKQKFAAVEDEVRDLAERLTKAGELLRGLIDEDAAAYDVLSAAFKLDKADPARSERVQQAARLAASVPLETATLCAAVRTDVQRLREIGNPQLRSDAAAALHLAEAAWQAAAANVRANLPLLPPEEAQELERQLTSEEDG